jgi:hypothetical protein
MFLLPLFVLLLLIYPDFLALLGTAVLGIVLYFWPAATKQWRMLRAARILWPASFATSIISYFTWVKGDFVEPVYVWYDYVVFVIFAILLFLGFGYFSFFPVRPEELDKEQKEDWDKYQDLVI